MAQKDLLSALNVYLANQQVNYFKTLSMHWYIKGKGFFVLHKKLEDMYLENEEICDSIAERILALGGNPNANMKGALELATIPERVNEPISDDEVVREIASSLTWWIDESQKIVDLAEKEGDGATQDMFNEYIAKFQKDLWMIRSYLA